MRLTKGFMAIFAPAESLPSPATLDDIVRWCTFIHSSEWWTISDLTWYAWHTFNEEKVVIHGTAYSSVRRAKRHIYDENTLWTLSILTFQPNNQLAKVANILWLGDALVASVVRLLSVILFLVQMILFSWNCPWSKQKVTESRRNLSTYFGKNKVISGKEIPKCQTWVIESEKMFQANKR